jgi:hypothetical protein
MQFDLRNPLAGLKPPPCRIWDAHIHVWDAARFSEYRTWADRYGIEAYTAIASPDVKHALEEAGKDRPICFALYFSKDAFAQHDTAALVDSVEKAKALGYGMVKMWFGPRFLDFANAQKPFAISHPAFDEVFSRIEELGLPVDIHVADPDIWYKRVYTDTARYRTKRQAIYEFISVLNRHPGLRAISVHFGSLPEPENLPLLASMLDRHDGLYIDTASTKWVIRELGRNPDRTRDFIITYQKRILFASDLSVGWDGTGEDYFATRYWAQRLFWETDVRGVELPFHDEDSEEGATRINGLMLPEDVLKKLYWENAAVFFQTA